MDDLTKRAYAAYFRYHERADQNQPDHRLSYPVIHDGKQYVLLRNERGVLAVYRVRNDGMLKALKRWPAELADIVK